MTTENRLKAKLKSGGRVFGTWSMLSCPEGMMVMSKAGLDFIVIDMEHGTTSFETAQNQLFATRSSDCTTVIRLGENNESTILRALDIGAQALMVSHISTAEEAQRVVRAAKYRPEGERGLSAFTVNHDYSDADMVAKLRLANEQTFIGVLIEGKEGIRNLDSIASVPGLDMIYLGIYDISQTLGVPGDLNHPEVRKLLRECVKIADSKGLAAGSVAPNKEYLSLLIETGFRFVSYKVDCAILREGFEIARKWFDEMS